MVFGPRSTDHELPESEWFGSDALIAADDAVPLAEATVSTAGPDADRGSGGDGGPGDGDSSGGGASTGRRPTWAQVILLALALAFLGGAVGYVVGKGRPPGEGSADVGFLRDMIDHHEQAVAMARLTIPKDVDPITRSFADEVVLMQQREIGLMDALLDEWGHARGDLERRAMLWMGMDTSVAAMPGMQSEEAIAALREATGREADRLFLTMMRDHHIGGVHMADYAAEHAGSERVRTLARRMAEFQRAEAQEYTGHLRRLGLEQ